MLICWNAKGVHSQKKVSRVRRHHRQITEVTNNRCTKQQGCQRAEGGKKACNKSNEDDWTQRTAHKVEHKRQI